MKKGSGSLNVLAAVASVELTCIYVGGTKDGVWIDGTFRKGKIRYADGSYWEGTWDEPVNYKRPNGVFSIFLSDDTLLYEGRTVNGLPHGKGTMWTAVDCYQSGEWIEGIFQRGTGAFYYADGAWYEGEMFLTHPNGKGKIVSKSICMEGRFEYGQFKTGSVSCQATCSVKKYRDCVRIN